MTISKRVAAVALVVTALAGFGLGRIDLGESCDSWKDRHTEALARSIYHLDEPGTLAAIEAQRPEGCR
jgi:hypothetical protein